MFTAFSPGGLNIRTGLTDKLLNKPSSVYDTSVTSANDSFLLHYSCHEFPKDSYPYNIPSPAI